MQFSCKYLKIHLHMQTYPQGLAGTQLFQHTVLTAFPTGVSCATKIVPLFTHFPQVEASLPSLDRPSAVPYPKVPTHFSRFLLWPSFHPGFFSHTTPSPFSSLLIPLSSCLPRFSPSFAITVSSQFNRFPQLTAPLPVPGLRLPSTAQSRHPSTTTSSVPTPPQSGGSAQPAGDGAS